MSALAKMLSPGALPLFNYAGLNDPELEQQVRAATTRIRVLQRAAIVDIGRELIAIKDRLPHGSFLKWLEAEFNWSRRTAVNYMSVAVEFGEKWETVAHLQPGTLYLLAAPSTPPEVRATVLQGLGPNQVVTTGNVRVLIDSVKESASRKRRREFREERKRGQETERARLDAEYAQIRARADAEREKARDAAEQVRSLLGGYYPEVCELLADLPHHAFTEAFFNMVTSDAARRAASGGAA